MRHALTARPAGGGAPPSHSLGVIWPRGRDGHSIPGVARDSGYPPATPTVAFRRSWARWLMVLFTSVAPGLIFLSGVLVNSTHGWEKIANGAAVLAFAVLGVRTARLGIFAWPERLVVRDFFRTYQIRWPEIASFEMPAPYGTWRKSGLRIHLIDGRVISATLYGRGQLDTGRAVRTVVQELDRLRRQKTGDRAADAPPPASAS
jgi:hypothetical protein